MRLRYRQLLVGSGADPCILCMSSAHPRLLCWVTYLSESEVTGLLVIGLVLTPPLCLILVLLQVGVHSTCAISIIQELGGSVPPQLAAAAVAAGLRLPSASAPTSPTSEKPGRSNSLGSALAGLSGRAPQTLMALSAQLVSASEAVNAAAAQLRLFAEEVRAALASAASSPASSAGGAVAASPGGMPNAVLPVMVAAV
jgi:hypothetical protein